MAPSLVKVYIFSFLFGSLTLAIPNVNSQLHRRGLIIANPSTLPGKWSSIGCYLDGATTGRTLSGATYINGTAMTEESCVTFCDSQGYDFAGVEFSQECYCGNGLTPNTTEPITDCNMACSGNSTEACGGPDRLNVFWSGKQPPPAPMTNPGPNGWTSLGCYTEGATGRTLQNGMTVPGGSNAMTVAACTYACKQAGYSFSGVEYAQECYCDNAISNGGVPAPISDCNMVCTGNSSEFCGAGNRLDVYELSSLLSTSSSIVVSTTTSSKTSSTSITKTTTTSSKSSSTSSTKSSTSSSSTKSSTSSSSTKSSTKSSTSSSSTKSSTKSSTSSSSTKSSTSSSSTKSSSKMATPTTSITTSSTQTTKTTTTSSTKNTSTTTSKSTTTSSTSKSSTKTSSSTSSSKSSSTSLSSSSSSSSSTSSLATPTPTGPVHVASVGGYTWIGCFTEGTGTRALGSAVSINYNTMTVEQCQTFCSSPTVYQYFGLEYAGECYCGNALQGGSVLAQTTDCSMLCDGSPYEYCGAGNRLDVYQLGNGTISSISSSSPSTTATRTATTTSSTTTTSAVSTTLPTSWSYGGCWVDGANGRILRYGQPDSQTNSIESCVNTCIGLGYSIAGMEFSTQCFCDNQIYNGGVQAADTDCNMACAGNAKEICGAANRLSIYNTGSLTVYQPPKVQTTGIGNWTYEGCWTDNVNDNRALFWQIILTNNNTANSCLGLCQEYGYMAAGMEYGDECYCGDDASLIASGSTLRPDSECTVPCSGNSQTICGDGNRLSYYRWTGPALYTWHYPSGINAGQYEFFVPGVVVPLMTSLAINNKVTFLEKHGTGAPNTTGAYELDLSLSNDFNLMWREMHVQTDIFCSGGLTLPDKGGRQLTVGGWAGGSTFGVRLYWPDGSAGVNGTNDWQENQNELLLQSGRWYPSTMMMSNGSILVTGGEIGSNSAANPTLEILPKPVGGYVKYLDWLDRTDPNNLYPFMFVLPSGGIFAAYWNEARILDPVTFDTRTVLPTIPGSVANFQAGRTYPLEGTAVMLPQHAPYTDPATMMICGGSAAGNALAIDNCVSLQPDLPGANWTIERMPSQRVMPCITALPDGTFLILNGAQGGVAGFGLAVNPNLNAVLYDPSQPVGSRMSIMANTIVARLYHSEAILLPDGSVLVSGSDPQDGTHPEEYRVEKFLLPYNLNGVTPPAIIAVQNTDWTQYNTQYTITVNLPSGNWAGMKISLLGAVSSTHGNSMGQRTYFPAFTYNSANGQVTITSPKNSYVCPPAWLQLFVLDNGTPSTSKWVRIGGDPASLGNWPSYPDFTVPGV